MDPNRVDLIPPGADVPVVFTGAPCKHHTSVRRKLRALPKGHNYVAFESEIDALIHRARVADTQEEQIRRAMRLLVVPPSREAVP